MSRFSGLVKMIFIVLIVSALIFLTIFCNKQIETNPYSGKSKIAQAESSPLSYVQNGTLYYRLKGTHAIKITDDFDSDRIFIAPDNGRLAYFKGETRKIENPYDQKNANVRSLYHYDIRKAVETKVSDNCLIEEDSRLRYDDVGFGYKGFLFYTAFDPDDRSIDINIFNGTVSMPLINDAHDFTLSGNYLKVFYTSYRPQKSVFIYYMVSRKNHLIDEDVNEVLNSDEIEFDYFLYDKKTDDGIDVYLWSNGIRKAVPYDPGYTREYSGHRSYFYKSEETGGKTYSYHMVKNDKDTLLAKNVIDHFFDPVTGNLLYVTKSGYYYKPANKAPVLLAAKQMEFFTDDWETFYCLDFSGNGNKSSSDLYSFRLIDGKTQSKTLIDENVAGVMTFPGMNGAVYYKNDGTDASELYLITNTIDGSFDKKTDMGTFTKSYRIRYLDGRLYILLSETDKKTPGDLLVFDNDGVKTLLKSARDMIVRNDTLYAVKNEGAGDSIYEIDDAAVKIAENVRFIY